MRAAAALCLVSVACISAPLEIGAPISVFSSTDGGASSHLRNQPAQDGAIVVGPTAASPTFMLFAFSDQVF
jgi:hypothetical protein